MLKRNGALYGLTEAARELLEMDDNPPDWYEAEYVCAIDERFPEGNIEESIRYGLNPGFGVGLDVRAEARTYLRGKGNSRSVQDDKQKCEN